MYSTEVVTTGHALKPKPFQFGMLRPRTSTRVPNKFISIADVAQIAPGFIIFWELKKALNCEKKIRTGRQMARTEA